MNTIKEKQPSWLKAMQNGSIGEARAKAFLMDRFWILERSVDIDGADLIIQRKITEKTLFDKTSPNLGVVQVKFFESKLTTQYIHEKYILDDKGETRDFFFLLCNTGYEENIKMFFLTPKVIKSDFTVVEKDGIRKYKLPGSKILESEKYLIKSKKNTLDRIEQDLKLSDFIKNRSFISWQLPGIIVDPSAILSDYKEPINNSMCDIPCEFKNIKENAIKLSQDVYILYDNLKCIAENINPIESVYIIDNLEDDLSRISSNIKELLGTNEFYSRCLHHKDIVEALKEDGLLDNYIETQNVLREKISNILSNNLPLDPNKVLLININFSLDDFKILNVDYHFENICIYFNILDKRSTRADFVDMPFSYNGIKEISNNSFEYYLLAGRYIFNNDNQYGSFNYNNLSFFLYVDCMDKMYELKYCNKKI